MKYTFPRWLIVALLWAIGSNQSIKANSDSITIRVHFLHGSKPKFKFRHQEDRWFGGILGGHAGIEYEPNRIINFQPKARFHVFAHRQLINSRFTIHDTLSFYEILGGKFSSVKKTMISIRISARQKVKLDSIANAYTQRSPYDYAFFGMRCGAASYDVLAGTGLVRHYGFTKTWRRFFYPRKVRRYLERHAEENEYSIRKATGSNTRTWEKD